MEEAAQILEIEIQVGTKRYTITRASEKYIRRLKGEETQEAKTDLNFEVYDEVLGDTVSLNGLSRIHTDAIIRRCNRYKKYRKKDFQKYRQFWFNF